MSRIMTVALLAGVLMAGFAVAESDDFVMGNYSGAFTGDDWKDRPIRVQVVAMSVVRYRAIFFIGQEERVQVKGKKRARPKGVPKIEDEVLRKKAAVIDFKGAVEGRDGLEITGTIAKEKFTGEIHGAGINAAFALQRTFLDPPTRGMTAPEGAVVLLDGSNLDQWELVPRWRLQGSGSIKTSGSDIRSKQEFGDAQYHIEFLCPFMPSDSGQARGNSGVYVMGRYEVQVLDSFGDLPKDNLCGGIYQRATPVVCASLPPLQWQTYDITFKAPRFDASGNKTQNAVITVNHNGIVIHDNVALTDRTPGGASGPEASKGVLLLQGHGDRVEFRNVWVKPLD